MICRVVLGSLEPSQAAAGKESEACLKCSPGGAGWETHCAGIRPGDDQFRVVHCESVGTRGHPGEHVQSGIACLHLREIVGLTVMAQQPEAWKSQGTWSSRAGGKCENKEKMRTELWMEENKKEQREKMKKPHNSVKNMK